MVTTTREQIQNSIYNNIAGLRSWALMDAPTRISSLEALKRNANNLSKSVPDVLNVVDIGLLNAVSHGGHGVSDTITNLAEGFERLRNPFESISLEKAQEAARVASYKAISEQDNALGFLSDLGYALSKSFSFSWPPFSLDAFQDAMAIAPVRRQAIAVYDSIKGQLGEGYNHIAEMVSGIGPDNEFKADKLPVYLNPESEQMQAVIRYQAKQPASQNTSMLADAYKAFKDDPWSVAYVAAPSYLAYKASGPAWAVTKKAWEVGSNAVIGGTLDIARDIKGGISSVGDTTRRITARFTAESKTDLKHKLATIDTDAFERRTTQLARTAELTRTAKFSRSIGKIGAVLGFIPLAGGVVSAAESTWYANHALAANERGELSDEDLASILTGLSVHAAVGFGGFIAQGIDETMLVALESAGHGKYLPSSIPKMVKEGMDSLRESGENALKYLQPLHRPAYVNNGKWPGYDQALTNEMVIGFHQGKIPEEHPHIQALLRNYTTKNIHDAAESMLSSGLFGTGIKVVTQLWVPQGSANERKHATAKELYNDLVQRGPIYWRLMDHALARGISLNEFNGDIQFMVSDISQNYLASAQNANMLYDLGTKLKFGGMDSRYIALANKDEWDRVDRLGSSVTEHLSMLNQAVRNTATKLEQLSAAYFVSDKDMPLTYAQLANALNHNVYMQDWLKSQGKYEEFIEQFSNLARKTPDATVSIFNNTTLGDFFTHIQGDGKAAYQSALDAALTDIRTSYEVMAPIFNGRKHVEQAVLLIYALPPSIANARPELSALLEEATKLRAMAQTALTQSANGEIIFSTEHKAFAEALGKFIINSEKVLSVKRRDGGAVDLGSLTNDEVLKALQSFEKPSLAFAQVDRVTAPLEVAEAVSGKSVAPTQLTADVAKASPVHTGSTIT